jgi:flagellar export protein FliJ
MSRRTHPADRGLAAVARVREVRERDSRLGLVEALADLRAREARVAELEAALRQHGSFVSGDMATFVALRESLVALRESLVADRATLAVAQTVAMDADARWQADRSRLGAVEGLLDRRADERRVERRRADDKDLDEVASQGWLRRAAADAGHGGAA